MCETSTKFKNEAAFLGINAKTAANLQPRGLQRFSLPSKIESVVEQVDPETGEVSFFIERTEKGFKKLVPYKSSQQARTERYALKSVVNRIFPTERVAKCCRCRCSESPVKILKSSVHGKAHYSGLVTCASVWSCPVCAAKIAERRRSELVAATATAKAMDMSVYLVTFTIRHGLGDNVKLILNQMRSSWRKMISSRAYKSFHAGIDIAGTIRALEVTYGQNNGFHPHYHVLVFTRNSVEKSFLESQFSNFWISACVSEGLPEPSIEHAVRVDDGTWAARYASKWGLEDEMVKGHLKTSKGIKGMTPWDMLRDVLVTGSESSRRLFAVYAKAFKGQRQLYWSNGLKQLLSVTDLNDEEIASIEEDSSYELAQLTEEEWKAVLFTRSEAVLLDIAERDSNQIQNFLNSLIFLSKEYKKSNDISLFGFT